MSDLHKLFMKRVHKQEQAFGLSLLSEDLVEGEEELIASLAKFPPPGGLSSSLGPPRTAPSNRKAQRSDDNHFQILKTYEAERNKTFPIIEQYQLSDVSLQVYYRPPSSEKCPIFICHHGAGSSSMTYCKLAQSLEANFDNGTPGVLAYDTRGHGKSTMGSEADYSLTTLTNDFKSVLEQFHERHNVNSSLYLLGHSLGGAVMTSYLDRYQDTPYQIRGLIMLDIVEETAVTSLNAMPLFIDRMPKTFPNYKLAIEWHVKATGLLKNLDSAEVSVPDLFTDNGKQLNWCIDLKETQPFWSSWFTDLSENFVKCGLTQNHVAKLLLLAGHETLDTNLIIGQMQGKYQLIVFNNSNAGHFLHEDIPKQISISLIDFTKRNDSPDEYMQKELGFVPKWGGKINK